MLDRPFDRLVVLSRAKNDRHGRARWNCRCVCGSVTIVLGIQLRSGHTTSCGCARSDATAARNTTHGLSRQHPAEYRTWKAMRQRCNDANCDSYKDYGARGIRVCRRWDDFAVFLADMGPKPTPAHTIERKKGRGGYSPSNCIWVTRAVQNKNTRATRWVALDDGTRVCLADAARSRGLKPRLVYGRIHRGDSEQRALR
jgi:hypothetical protein